MSKSNTTCCIKGCKKDVKNFINDNEKLKFYSFPCDSPHTPWKSKKRKQWIEAIRKYSSCDKNWTPSKSSRICSAHFYGNEKSEHPLHPSYSPQIFPGKCSLKKLEQQLGRFLRQQERNKLEQISKITNIKYTISTLNLPKKYINIGCQTEIILYNDYDDKISDTYHWCSQIIRDGICEASVQVHINISSNRKMIDNKSKDVGIHAVTQSMNASTQYDNLHQNYKCFGFHGVPTITEEALRSLAGVSLKTFNDLLSKAAHQFHDSKLSKENRLLLFFIKLKLGLSYPALSCMFDIHRTTAQRTFISVLQCLRIILKNTIYWPSREVVGACLPYIFKKHYPTTRVIIDCVEIRVETLSNNSQNVSMNSNYKPGSTVKFLVGCTPTGFVSFLSDCYGGRADDCSIAVDSGLIDLMEPGDMILANEKLWSIQTNLLVKKSTLVVLSYDEKPQCTSGEGQKTCCNESVRIHMEKIMKKMRDFCILKKISVSLLPHIDDIVYVTCALANFYRPIQKNLDKSQH